VNEAKDESAEVTSRIRVFLDYVAKLKGDEKGEAQIYLDRLFQAFGHGGTIEAGAVPEDRLAKKTRGTRFLDLHWPGRVLIEMKKRGERLERHYDQAFSYWMQLVPDRPPYVILCNFDEFWIYDFNAQLYDPMDRVSLSELPDRWGALQFLRPTAEEPRFRNNLVEVTRGAADAMARVFQAMVKRGEQREIAQRFILQSLVAMFSEDVDLLPRGLFYDLVKDCLEGTASSYDLIGGLFEQMNKEQRARGGRFKDVDYFNGGLFSVVEPVELQGSELELLMGASEQNWAKVNPAVFGTLLQSSMEEGERHAFGAHFTTEADIQKVVEPTITRPWRERIEAASTLKELQNLRSEMRRYVVLDPACGSGNFLYVAYRELKRLERELVLKAYEGWAQRGKDRMKGTAISLDQFRGMDILAFAVELARVTLTLAKEIDIIEVRDRSTQDEAEFEEALPLDNLEDTIIVSDAHFTDWPRADAIVGNPPYQSKNKMQQEYGAAYVHEVRARYPDVPGRADFCVYWFHRAHNELEPGGRAGLVGTNTIRQNYSREGGLDHIVSNGGTITEAVSSQVWSGDAAVHVSIVNWVKGDQKGKKKLFKQLGDDIDSPWEVVELDRIGPALSGRFDVTQARKLSCNADSDTTFQGQTHGHKGFLLPRDEAEQLLEREPDCAEVLFPYLTFDELIRTVPPEPQRYVIDFYPRDVLACHTYRSLYHRVEEQVLPDRQAAAEKEKTRNAETRAANAKARVNRHHENFLRRWWQLSYPRGELMKKISTMKRYVVCGQVTKRPTFAFISSDVHPNAQLQVFAFEDDYSFGVLQSNTHWEWFTERCSTLTERFRYTSNTVYDSFPWPQAPSLKAVREVAQAAVELRKQRRELIERHGLSLRQLYRSLERPGDHPLKTAHAKLDLTVRRAYGMKKREPVLDFLFELNGKVAAREDSMQPVVGPGLPPCVTDPTEFITSDALPFSG